MDAPTAALILPKGYGFSPVSPAELREQGSLLDMLLVWEPPRKRGHRRYVIGVDVSDGIGQDRSVIEVARMGTIDEPAEEVAQFVTESTSPTELAAIIFAVGKWYTDEDGIEAKVAVECNNHGLSTQDTLSIHLQYQNLFVWEFLDSADPASRFSTRIGWYTTSRTRPILLDKFHSALTTLDPITGLPDYVTHSPILHEELKDFQTQGGLWEAEAARGAHDDAVMAACITNYIAYRLQSGETEPLEERRRRRSEQALAQATAAAKSITPVDFRNTPATAEDQSRFSGQGSALDDEEDLDTQLYDPRSAAEVPDWRDF